jgi:N-carbamoyl-L-amino-acid hydrolase
VLRSLNDHKVATRHPVTLVIFTNEEGARFQPAMIASGVMAGKISLEYAYNVRDKDGVRLLGALEKIGYTGPEPCAPRPMRAYLELHIEQGPVLEEARQPVGVVEGIVAISWSRVTLHGVQAHAGPTPMDRRKDALVAAAEIIGEVRKLAGEIGGGVTTIGSLDVRPNITNAIPGEVRFSIDVRHPEDAAIDRALPRIDEIVKTACARERVRAEVDHYWRVPRTNFAPDVVAAVEGGAKAATGGRYRRMLSGAGHDAQYMAAIGPTGMIFVPSRGGLSHCEEEFTAIDDIEPGANTLLLAAAELAGRA